jgi:hypothetical protein
MLDWSELKVAKAQREFLAEQATLRRRYCRRKTHWWLQITSTGAASRIGTWLIALGLWLHSSSTDMKEILREWQALSGKPSIQQADQNC